VEAGAAARLRNEDLKPANLMGLIMNEDNVPAETGPSHSGKADSWRRHLPYLLVLALALAGVAYANMSQKSLAGYWELLALISGIVCIFTEWGKTEDKQAHVRLVWTQAVHWIAVLVAMNIMLLSGVQQLLPAPATSLVLLMLLALGSFLAGLILLPSNCAFSGWFWLSPFRQSRGSNNPCSSSFSPEPLWSALAWPFGQAGKKSDRSEQTVQVCI
jgi:hypothetical protein